MRQGQQTIYIVWIDGGNVSEYRFAVVRNMTGDSILCDEARTTDNLYCLDWWGNVSEYRFAVVRDMTDGSILCDEAKTADNLYCLNWWRECQRI